MQEHIKYKKKVFVVSGTPCTGKTFVAKRIAKKFGLKYINVNFLVKKNHLYDLYDRKRKTLVVDTKKLNSFLEKLVVDFEKKKSKFKGLVLDSHLSHFLPRKYVDLCIITKCDLKALEKRLKKRQYSKEKIKENLDSEIFDSCLMEAEEKGHNIEIIDTTKGVNGKALDLAL